MQVRRGGLAGVSRLVGSPQKKPDDGLGNRDAAPTLQELGDRPLPLPAPRGSYDALAGTGGPWSHAAAACEGPPPRLQERGGATGSGISGNKPGGEGLATHLVGVPHW